MLDAMSSSMAGPSNPRRISGLVPGLLDPSQPERLYRLSGSRLQFASFDPLIATARQGAPDFCKLPIDGKTCRPKRIVIETTPNGDSFWRYVPNARLDDGVENEGQWPRHVEICGDVVECSQDQWDIYKLDPLYECRIRNPPYLAQVTRVTDNKTTATVHEQKRPASTSPIESFAPLGRQRKRTHPISKGYCVDVRDDTMDVEPMDVDEPPTKCERQKSFLKVPVTGRNISEGRQGKTPDRGDVADSQGCKKRKLADISESPSTLDDFSRTGQGQRFTNYTAVQKGKRARTTSPMFVRRELESKRQLREKLRRRTREPDSNFVQPHEREEAFKNLKVDATQQMDDARETQNRNEPEFPQSEEDEEVARQTAIEESRRKLAELEADKPLWGAAAKQRSQREEMERRSIRVKVTTLHSAEKEITEAEHKARTLREEGEKCKEEARSQQEAAAQRERERRRRQQQRWAFGPWTTQRALERYKVLSEEFDSTKFSTDLPLTMEAVPWPILTPPARLNIADVNWGAVEKFFTAVKNHMKPQDYKVLVERSHRRFHPDRWRSRALWKTVVDETERDGMEVAANTVAQALTPIWRAATGR